MTDINFGISPTPIEQSRSIYVTSEKLSIKHHIFENVPLQEFLNGLIEVPLKKREFIMSIQKRHNNSHNAQDKRYFLLSKDKKITVKHCLNVLTSL